MIILKEIMRMICKLSILFKKRKLLVIFDKNNINPSEEQSNKTFTFNNNNNKNLLIKRLPPKSLSAIYKQNRLAITY